MFNLKLETEMKSKFYLGILSIMLLTTGGLLPIAKLNDKIISIFPVWDNIELYNGLWQWRDISFFSVTLVLLIFFSVYLMITKKYKGFIVSGVLSVFLCLIIFAALLQVQSKVTGIENITFSFSWGLLIVLAGGITSIINSSGTGVKR